MVYNILFRAGSKLTSNQYCMPVLGLIFLRYAYSRFKAAYMGVPHNTCIFMQKTLIRVLAFFT